jgi:hypothetical protein
MPVTLRSAAPLLALLLLALSGAPVHAAAPPPVRREARLLFGADAAFQDRGGVQYFYELLQEGEDPRASEAWRTLRTLDPRGEWSPRAGRMPLLFSRIVYTVEQDVAQFSDAERALDADAMNALVPGLDVRRLGPDTFRAEKTPANTFRVRHLSPERFAEEPSVPLLLALSPAEPRPAAVVMQRNWDFARVMGVRTGELSLTWTAHHAIAPGRTRVTVLTLSLMHNLPPFFLGGAQRVHDEALGGALHLIDRLRRPEHVTQR